MGDSTLQNWVFIRKTVGTVKDARQENGVTRSGLVTGQEPWLYPLMREEGFTEQ
jgi:hypothetical protein